jgi:hypothetical protein
MRRESRGGRNKKSAAAAEMSVESRPGPNPPYHAATITAGVNMVKGKGGCPMSGASAS